MVKSRIGLIIFFFLLLFFMLVVFQSKLHRFKSDEELPEAFRKEMAGLASESLRSLDVPVGALLVYEHEIIGRGFNTVRLENNVSGHAEINAINDAIKKMGLDAFSRLNREKLVLYTTFEPCEMCRGTMLHYNILNMHYVKAKSLTHWWRVQLKGLRYELKKRQTGDEDLQDSLFMLHPDYPDRNK
ncbi:MAG: nucleoside deaminase [Bacteroidetes bacterium]|nr:nucleoside deaminase [Bacteroidota bacterium]